MFQKAVKHTRKARVAIYGTPGSGKTYSSLSIATGLGDKIALIDTERGSSELYADQFNFDVAKILKATIDNYIHAIENAKSYDVIIIDSLSHAWKELLAENERLTATKYQNNSFRAWGESTPRQNLLVNALLDFPGHLIVTMRSKVEYTLCNNEKGKKVPIRIGLAPVQREDMEYEFDILLNMDSDNFAKVEKSRIGYKQGEIIEKPGKEFGQTILNCIIGKDITYISAAEQKKLFSILKGNEEIVREIIENFGYFSTKEIKKEDYKIICELLKTRGELLEKDQEPT